jgi:hypothetical protein
MIVVILDSLEANRKPPEFSTKRKQFSHIQAWYSRRGVFSRCQRLCEAAIVLDG